MIIIHEILIQFFLPVPLVSKVCPSDIYRVWKSGSCLRVDTTLLGFEHMTWLKGRRSYIFKGEGASDADLAAASRSYRVFSRASRVSFSSDDGAVVMEVDHEKQVVYTEPLVLSPRDAPSLLAAMQPSQENTAQRLTSPIVSTHLNTRNISFERYWPRPRRRGCGCEPAAGIRLTDVAMLLFQKQIWYLGLALRED